MTAGDICLHGYVYFMLSAMQKKHSMQLHRRVSLRSQVSAKSVRSENDFVVPTTFQNFLVHLPVAPVVAAFSADCIHNDLAAGLSCLRINLEGASFERKRSVHGMKRTPQRPMHAALYRVESENKRSRFRLRYRMSRQSNQARERHKGYRA